MKCRKKATPNSESELELSDDSETEGDDDEDPDLTPVKKRIELRPRKQVNFAEASDDSEPDSPHAPKTPPDIRPAAAAAPSADTSQVWPFCYPARNACFLLAKSLQKATVI